MYRWRSCSQVNPMPPWTCRPEAMTRLAASLDHTLAVEAAMDASASPADRAHAAYQVLERMPSTSTTMSAQRCLMAWKLPMG